VQELLAQRDVGTAMHVLKPRRARGEEAWGRTVGPRASTRIHVFPDFASLRDDSGAGCSVNLTGVAGVHLSGGMWAS